MKNIYEFDSYKTYLKQLISEHIEKRGFQASLARAAGCQPSYISQALSGKAELLVDHAAGISEFVGLNQAETEYFITLVQFARATSPILKKIMKTKLQTLKEKQFELVEQIQGLKKTKQEIEGSYYSSWMWTAIHIITSIPQYQTPQNIAERLSLPLIQVKEILQVLQTYGFIQENNNNWVYTKGASHLPRESSMNELNHTHWRLRSISNIQKQIPDDLHYTSVFSMSLEDTEKLRKFLIETIAGSRGIIGPSQSEDIFCMNLDFFRV